MDDWRQAAVAASHLRDLPDELLADLLTDAQRVARHLLDLAAEGQRDEIPSPSSLTTVASSLAAAAEASSMRTP